MTPPTNADKKLSNWAVIKGIEGKFYPCKPDGFEVIYEQIREVPL
jgi:hypothetical protein